MVLKIALPNKGRLSEPSNSILSKIGLSVIREDRKLFRDIGKYQILFASAQDIPEFVSKGAADLGITGLDLVMEKEKPVEVLLKLNFGECKLVVAVPESANIQTLEQIKPNAVVATTYPRLTEKFFKARGKSIKLVSISGATEIAPHIGAADLITDLVSTGSTLKTNRLKSIETVMESSAVLIGNKLSVEKYESKISEIVGALESVVNASKKRYVMANVPVSKLEEVKSLIPGISGPTVMNLIGTSELVAVHAVAAEEEINGIIAALRALGATGILVLPIERMVL